MPPFDFVESEEILGDEDLEGTDLREKPYHLFRIRIDAQPVLLR